MAKQIIEVPPIEPTCDMGGAPPDRIKAERKLCMKRHGWFRGSIGYFFGYYEVTHDELEYMPDGSYREREKRKP